MKSNVSAGNVLGTNCKNVISSGENDVSCDALKLTSDMYQSSPTTSKYNLVSSILSAIKFALTCDF